MVTPLKEWKRPGLVLLKVFAATLVLAFLAALVCSRLTWGYFFQRPGVDPRILQAKEIVSATPVTTRKTEDGFTFEVAQEDSLPGYMSWGRQYPYDSPASRVLLALEERKLLPSAPRKMPSGRLAAMYSLVESTSQLVDGESWRYGGAKMVSGVILEAIGTNDESLLFVAVRGGEVSNDHYPFYEFLFSAPELCAEFKLVSWIRFYYDIAGIEGFEWPAMFVLFALVGTPLTLTVSAVVLRLNELALK